MSQRNIILVGFMGSGKTTAAKRLGARLGRDVVSSDEWIVRKENRPITDIFEKSGEPYFRRVEKEVIREIAQRKNIIVDCGGGVVLDPDNMTNLKKTGTVFYLSASPEFIYACVKDQTHRPLLNVPDPLARIKELLAARAPHYAQADIIISSDNRTIEDMCDEIIERMSHETE